NEDFNGATQEGAGYYQLTTWNGLRSSAATAYLRPARGRANLRVETEAHATRLECSGTRAAGVRYRQGGAEHIAHCRGEVLLAAGALQTPQLLQWAGVGPGTLLQEHGISVLRDAPGVGANLQDHLQIRLIYECSKPITT